MAITNHEALEEYPALKAWAKKARDELQHHRMFVAGENTDEAEDRNDEDVITLCEEYDRLFA